MQRLTMATSFAVLVGLSPVVLAGASQNPHDASNQPLSDESQNPHDTVNQPGNTLPDTGSPNPNSLGRTGRLNQSGDDGSGQTDQGVQPPPVNDNPSSRIEDINDDDRQLHDRLDGRTQPTADPSLNSDNPGEPVPAGQGPAVNPDAGGGNSATSGSDVAPGAGSTSGSRATSGSGAASGGSGSAAGGAR